MDRSCSFLLKSVVALVFLLGVLPSLYAEDNDSDKTVGYTMDEVVVSATRWEMSKRNTTADVTVITRQEDRHVSRRQCRGSAEIYTRGLR